MEGIFYDNGKQVASNGQFLIVLNEEYAPELEGKIIDKNGEECEGIYPKYKTVIPKMDGYQAYDIDVDRFYDWIDERRAAYKLQNAGKHVKWSDGWFVRIGHCLFKAKDFNMVIKAGKMLGSLTINTIAADRASVIKSEKGTFLAMPWREADSDDVLILTDGAKQ